MRDWDRGHQPPLWRACEGTIVAFVRQGCQLLEFRVASPPKTPKLENPLSQPKCIDREEDRPGNTTDLINQSAKARTPNLCLLQPRHQRDQRHADRHAVRGLAEVGRALIVVHLFRNLVYTGQRVQNGDAAARARHQREIDHV